MAISNNAASGNTVIAIDILFSLASTIITTVTSDLEIFSVISGSGAVTKSGGGRLTLIGSNSFSEPLTVSNDTLILNDPRALRNPKNGTTINSGNALYLKGISYSALKPLTIEGSGITSGGSIFILLK